MCWYLGGELTGCGQFDDSVCGFNGCTINCDSHPSLCGNGGGSGGIILPTESCPPGVECSGGDGGGGSGTGTVDSSDAEIIAIYCERTRSGCLVALTPEQRAKIGTSIDPTRINMADPICAEARRPIAAARWFAGDSTLRDLPDGDHDAASNRLLRLAHVDQDFLVSSSLRSLGEIMLHEGWHLAGYANHTGENQPPYMTPPYSCGPSCIHAPP